MIALTFYKWCQTYRNERKKVKIILLLYNARRTFNLHGTFRDFSLIFRKTMEEQVFYIKEKFKNKLLNSRILQKYLQLM